MPQYKALLISCLCITENRPAFLPWLFWNYDKQRWPQRELLIVDSSPEPFVTDRGDVRVISAAPGTNVPTKRNLALQHAQGEIITWFDDDDWQHPDKCTWLVAALQNGAPYAGAAGGWFVNLQTLRCVAHRSRSRQIVFNSAGFRRDVALAVRFPEDRRKASDSLWFQALKRRYPRGSVELTDKIPFFWLCHGHNISNPAKRRRFTTALEHVRQLVGPAAWGETDAALAALQARLSDEGAQALPTLSGNRIQRPAPDAPQPPAPNRDGSATERAVQTGA